MVQINEVVSLHAYDILVAGVFFCSVFIQHLAKHGLICRLRFLPFFVLQVLMRQEVLPQGFFAQSHTCLKQKFILWHVPQASCLHLFPCRDFCSESQPAVLWEKGC